MTAALRMPVTLGVLLYQGVALALAQIWANKMRGFLTTLGIVIGVAAVSAVIALIDGMRNRVVAEFESFGTNKLYVSPKWRKSDVDRRDGWAKLVFKNDAFDHLLEFCPSVQRFTRHAGYGGLPVSYRAHTAEDRVQFNAVDPEWHAISRRGVTAGRPMTEIDSQQGRRVCLINPKMRDDLRLDRDPTGQTIEVAYFGRLQVIGMVEPPPTMMGNEAETGDLFVPFTFSTRAYAWPTWYSVAADVKSRNQVEDAKAELEFYLRQVRHLKPGEENNFEVITSQRSIDQVNELAGMMTTVAVGVISISLLVGGVGIMNIMLVTVSERTREIGLRKAVGATPGAILLQFLIEAVVLCLVGGALGLVFGQLLTSGVAAFLPADPLAWDRFKPGRDAWPVTASQAMSILLPPLAIAVAFGFSVTVGLIFGIFPAIKASRLDPIEALRHE